MQKLGRQGRMMQKSFYRSGIRALAGARTRLALLQVGGDLLQCGEVIVDMRETGVHGVDRQVSGTRGSPGGDVGGGLVAVAGPVDPGLPSRGLRRSGPRPPPRASRAHPRSRGRVRVQSSGTNRHRAVRRVRRRGRRPHRTTPGSAAGSAVGARPAPVIVWYLPLKVTDAFGPQLAHDLDLLLGAPAAVGELLAERLVLDGVPAQPDTEPEPPAGEQIDLGGLLGHQHRLSLRQDDDAGDEFQ